MFCANGEKVVSLHAKNKLEFMKTKKLIAEKSPQKLLGIRRLGRALGYFFRPDKHKVWKRSFRLWQLRPHQVDPLGKEQHKCTSCGTEYVGNYCPRCGQSARIGRFSFTDAMIHFLDVWGIGNRSMFRSLRDLIFRPGYMIRDYLSGKQSAYFPPIQMFFILAGFSLLVEHGLTGDSEDKEEVEFFADDKADPSESEVDRSQRPDSVPLASVMPERKHRTSQMDEEENQEMVEKMSHRLKHYGSYLYALNKSNPAVFSLLTLILYSLPLFFFFRHTPNIQQMRFSEFVVALVYTSNAYSIFSILGNLLDSGLFRMMALVMIFITLKQLTGYTKRRVFGYLFLTVIISTILAICAVVGVVYVAYSWG